MLATDQKVGRGSEQARSEQTRGNVAVKSRGVAALSAIMVPASGQSKRDAADTCTHANARANTLRARDDPFLDPYSIEEEKSDRLRDKSERFVGRALVSTAMWTQDRTRQK